MNFKTFKELVQLNKEFYSKVSADFSRTRQKSWGGWDRIIPFINEYYGSGRGTIKLKILDIGCGNGRFYSFLKKNLSGNFEYLGLDSSGELISEAKNNFPDVEFLVRDVFQDLESIESGFDIVVIFGVMHHVPSIRFRREWIDAVKGKLVMGGLLVISFWDLQIDRGRFEKKIKEHNFELEEGDYILGWGDENDAYRYAHFYSQNEIDDLLSGFKSLANYSDDGKTRNLNKYFILQNL